MPASRLSGSDGGSPGRVQRQCADSEGCVTMVGRRPILKVWNEKTRGRFPGAGFLNSCDDRDMPVICPTCQIFSAAQILPSMLLFKSLNRRCCWLSAHNLFGIGDGRCRDLGGGLLLRSGAGLCDPPCPRPRSSDPPGMCDRWSCGKSNDRTGHRAHGSQHDRARHRPQGSIAGTTLSSCFERQKGSRDRRRNKPFFHCGSLASAPQGTGQQDCGGTKDRR